MALAALDGRVVFELNGAELGDAPSHKNLIPSVCEHTGVHDVDPDDLTTRIGRSASDVLDK
jgi:hypothetical protein